MLNKKDHAAFLSITYYRTYGHCGSLDNIFYGSQYEYMLHYPLVYFRKDCRAIIDVELISPFFEEAPDLYENVFLGRNSDWIVVKNGIKLRAAEIPFITVSKNKVYKFIKKD